MLEGKDGPKRDIVLLNASAAIVAGGAEDLRGGMQIASESIDSGKAKASLKKLIEITHGSS